MAAEHYDRIVIHYAEIGTKGGNRPFFERRLRVNVDGALSGLGAGRCRRESGRLTVALSADAELDAILERLAEVPGVAWFAPAVAVASDLETIGREVLAMAVPHPPETFRIDTRRSFKQFPLTSPEVNREVGAKVVEATGRKVSLDHAAWRYGVEIGKKRTYVFWDRREGPGGLPVGSEQELIALMSGGIDSPVAAWLMMVRGCRIHLVHFLNRSVATSRVTEKITALAARLSRFHGPLELTIVPFGALQREIVMVVPAEYRMIVYRRTMFRIAERIREERGAYGFVTGDSVGQVASQTLENLRVIHDAADWPVYSPLAGMSKRDITDVARRIGTYETSILPHEDCCSFLVARHPETRADLERIRAVERFDASAGIATALAGAEVHRFDPRDAL